MQCEAWRANARITDSSSSRGGRIDLTVVAKPTRGELEAVRAIGMIGVLGEGVVVLVDAYDSDGVAGDGLLVTVTKSYGGFRLCRSLVLG